MECKNCGNRFEGKYCNQCGQSIAERLTIRTLWTLVVEDIFEIDGGLVYTTRQLCINSGTTAIDYINGVRKKYYSPLKYLIFWTAILFIVSRLIGHERTNLSILEILQKKTIPFSEESLSDYLKIHREVIFAHTDIFFLGAVPFLSLLSYIIYRKQKLFITELSVPYLYLCGQIAFILVITLPIILLLGEGSYTPLISLKLLAVYYLVFKIHRQMFNESWTKTIIKSLIIIWGGQIVYGIATYLVFNTLKLLV